ncbi:MAG TPA: crossover junction endodeoxyribonuclease RuvC [Actinomycetota bacterium]|nr:crossover junction endodeoxyribonuclease RuvC [Actinomycetota bacterium]
MSQSRGVRVLGIDPGLTRLGYAVVEEDAGRIVCLRSGTFTTSPDGQASERLASLWRDICEVADGSDADSMAVERVFLNANRMSAVGAIQASGVALVVAAQRGMPVFEYSPMEVKHAVVGTGSASKEQVAFMVSKITGDTATAAGPDASDAVAVAIAHLSHDRVRRVIGTRT